MARGDGTNGAEGPRGLVVVGKFLGRKPSRELTIRGERVTERPKIGIEADGTEFSVTCASDESMAAATSGWVKGDDVMLSVEARPPFDGRGPVKFFLAGEGGATTRWL